LTFWSKTLAGLKIVFLCFIEPPQEQRGTNTTIDMAKLTKRDIVVAISNQTGMVQHQVFDVVQRTLDKITDSLANNIAVELRNFGVFQPRLTKPRVGRNPNQPGSSFVIPPRATVKFKAGKIMRQRVEKLSRELKDAAERSTKTETTTPNGV
jgi:nucleoid DNA-binding protein